MDEISISNIDVGSLPILQLSEFAKHDHSGTALYNRSKLGLEYGRKVMDLCYSVPVIHGFYVFGFFDDDSLWKSVYVGKAGKGKTASLRDRLIKELKVERFFLWYQENMNHDDEIDRIKKLIINSGDYWNLDNVKTIKHIERSMKKAFATHVIWAATPNLSNDLVRDVEAELIKDFNPKGNIQRPASSHEIPKFTSDVIEEIRRHIDNAKPALRRSNM